MPKFKGSGILIRLRMGTKKFLRGVQLSHFEDLPETDKVFDYFVCGAVLDTGKSSTKKVDTDLCMSGKKNWKPDAKSIVDFEKISNAQALIVTPSQQ